MSPTFGGEQAITASFLASRSLLERLTFRLCLWGSSRWTLRLQRLSVLRCRLGGSLIVSVQILGLVCRMCDRTHARCSTCKKSEAAACSDQLDTCRMLPLLRESKQSESFGFQVSESQRLTLCLCRLSGLMTGTWGVLVAAVVLFWRLCCVGILHCMLFGSFPPEPSLESSLPSSLTSLTLSAFRLFCACSQQARFMIQSTVITTSMSCLKTCPLSSTSYTPVCPLRAAKRMMKMLGVRRLLQRLPSRLGTTRVHICAVSDGTCSEVK